MMSDLRSYGIATARDAVLWHAFVKENSHVGKADQRRILEWIRDEGLACKTADEFQSRAFAAAERFGLGEDTVSVGIDLVAGAPEVFAAIDRGEAKLLPELANAQFETGAPDIDIDRMFERAADRPQESSMAAKERYQDLMREDRHKYQSKREANGKTAQENYLALLEREERGRSETDAPTVGKYAEDHVYVRGGPLSSTPAPLDKASAGPGVGISFRPIPAGETR